MSERRSKDALDKPDKYLRNVWNISWTYFIYTQYIDKMAKECLIYPWDIPEVSVRNAWNKPEIC